jgi:stage V sporulation protein AD
MGTKDVTNMGATMAPSAADTILAHFRDTNTTPADFDLIATGDLGAVGSKLLREIMTGEGFDIAKKHKDCGTVIFDMAEQDVHSGGSGCGCCAVVFNAGIYADLAKGKLKKILFIPTGALFAPVSAQQGATIPAVAHCVLIEGRGF